MFKKISVIGAGTMGLGIAQVCAQSGFKTNLYDSSQQILTAAEEKISKNLKHSLLFGHINKEQAGQALPNITLAADLDQALDETDLVIEAILENFSLKNQLFQNLEKLTRQNTILASNTSSLSVTDMANTLQYPQRMIGLHFFNPPPAMKLVEIVLTNQTSGSVLNQAQEFVKNIKKTPIKTKDSPGFIVNRVMRPFFSEALHLIETGACGMRHIDQACRDIAKAPMGPFALADLIGLDVGLSATQSIYAALGEPARFKPSPIHQTLVDAGDLGRKTGRGFYIYQGRKTMGDNPKVTNSLPISKTALSPQAIWHHLAQAILQEAQLLVKEGISDPQTINTAVKLGSNLPNGPFDWG